MRNSVNDKCGKCGSACWSGGFTHRCVNQACENFDPETYALWLDENFPSASDLLDPEADPTLPRPLFDFDPSEVDELVDAITDARKQSGLTQDEKESLDWVMRELLEAIKEAKGA